MAITYLDGSYCFIGNNDAVKAKAMKTLSEKLNVPILDLKTLMYLPRTGGTEKEQALRAKYPQLKNIYELGFNSETFKKIDTKYGKGGKEIYQKQFELKFLGEVLDALDVGASSEKGIKQSAIINISKDFAVVSEAQKSAFKQMLIDEEFKDAIINPGMAEDYVYRSVIMRAKNVVCTNNPKGVKPKDTAESEFDTKEVAESYSKMATVELDSDNYYDKTGDLYCGVVKDEKIEKMVADRNAKIAEAKEAEAKIKELEEQNGPEPEMPKEFPKKKNFFARFFEGLANVATLGIFGKIKRSILKKEARSEWQVEHTRNLRKEKIEKLKAKVVPYSEFIDEEMEKSADPAMHENGGNEQQYSGEEHSHDEEYESDNNGVPSDEFEEESEKDGEVNSRLAGTVITSKTITKKLKRAATNEQENDELQM